MPPGSRLKRWLGTWIGLGIALLALPLVPTPLLSSFEQKTVDARLRWRGAEPISSQVSVVEIDGDSIDRFGQWPWPRARVAQIVDALRQAGARSIALDLIFAETSHAGAADDELLVSALRAADNVTLGFYLRQQARADGGAAVVLPAPVDISSQPAGGFGLLTRYPALELPLPALLQTAPRAGHVVANPDGDGTLRHLPLIVQSGDEIYPSLALRAVQRALADPPITLRPVRQRIPALSLGTQEIPISERGELWINFRAPFRQAFPYIKACDLLDGRVPAELIRGRIVFVGVSETGLGDIVTTPFDAVVPGVEIHATVADNLLTQRYLRDGATESLISALATLLLGALCGSVAWGVRRPLLAAAGSAALLFAYLGMAQLALTAAARHVQLVVPLLSGALAFTATAVWRNVFADERTRIIRKTFKQYVSPAIVDELLQDPSRLRLGGERRELTVLFSDIRGFTAMSEQMQPEQIVALLGEYLTPMTRIIQEHGGTIDKYMGDAIMSFFGAPLPQADHATRAAAAALAMRREMDRLAAEWLRRGLPAVRSGVGINSGPMAVGNMGSEMIFDYTVVGDDVNLGSRLEGLTREWGVDIIASEATVVQLDSRQFETRELDLVRVKGKQKPVRVFELLPAGSLGEELRRLFQVGVEAYRADDRDGARRAFEAVLALRSEDRPARVYIERVGARLLAQE